MCVTQEGHLGVQKQGQKYLLNKNVNNLSVVTIFVGVITNINTIMPQYIINALIRIFDMFSIFLCIDFKPGRYPGRTVLYFWAK